MYTTTQSINFAQSYIEYAPLNAGYGQEPATTIVDTVRNTIMNPPFCWPWNRNNYSSVALVQGQQDYTFPITDFGFLEKVSLTNAAGTYSYEIKDVYNTYFPGTAQEQQQPNAVSVKSVIYGASVTLRFIGVPDQAYTGVITYQSLVNPIGPFVISSAATAVAGNTTYTGTFNVASLPAGTPVNIAGFVTNVSNNGAFTVVSASATTLVVNNAAGVAETPTALTASAVNTLWSPIPDQFKDIFNNLFLAEALAVADDAREQVYRQRGIAALLSKAEGLNEMQVNAFLSQWLARGPSQTQGAQLRTQTGITARGI